MKITVKYSGESAICVPDLKVHDWVDKLVRIYESQTEDYTVVVGNEVMINAIRVAVLYERINHKDIVFSFEGEELAVDKDGRLPVWPNGFADTNVDLLQSLVGW